MQNDNKKNDAIEQGINERQYGVQYGTDAYTHNMKKGVKSKQGEYSGDPSEMRHAPGYEGAVPGVNTPDIRLPGKSSRDDVSIPAINPPVPNRAWTEMKNRIESLSEEEKRTLYMGHNKLS